MYSTGLPNNGTVEPQSSAKQVNSDYSGEGGANRPIPAITSGNLMNGGMSADDGIYDDGLTANTEDAYPTPSPFDIPFQPPPPPFPPEDGGYMSIRRPAPPPLLEEEESAEAVYAPPALPPPSINRFRNFRLNGANYRLREAELQRYGDISMGYDAPDQLHQRPSVTSQFRETAPRRPPPQKQPVLGYAQRIQQKTSASSQRPVQVPASSRSNIDSFEVV